MRSSNVPGKERTMEVAYYCDLECYADDSEFLISFPILLAFLGLILVILVSLSRKLEKGALEMEGVVVTVLTVANCPSKIKDRAKEKNQIDRGS
jgi:hypothetical protein